MSLDRMRRWFCCIMLFVVLITGLIYGVASWIGSGRLLMPPRKGLSENAVEMLAFPHRFGMRIDSAITKEGTPYLVCVPDVKAGPGHRGRVLLEQMEKATPGRPPTFGEVKGTLVLLHGWGARKEHLLATAERFCAAGYRCLIPDLPGHGMNRHPATGFGAGRDESLLAGQVLDAAAEKFDFCAHPVGLWGLSMGGAFALQAAAERPQRWDALVVVSSFSMLRPVVDGAIESHARGWSRWLDPGLSAAVRLRGGFWLDQVRPSDLAKGLTVPTLVLHGASDELIPVKSGRRIYDSLPEGRKQWIEVADARHGNVLGTPQHVFLEMVTWYGQWLHAPSNRGEPLLQVTAASAIHDGSPEKQSNIARWR